MLLIRYTTRGMGHLHLQRLEAIPDALPLRLAPHPARLHHLGETDYVGIEPGRQHGSHHRVLGSEATVDGQVGETQRLEERLELTSQT